MSFQVLAFGLLAEGTQIDAGGQNLRTVFATAFLLGLLGLGILGVGALRNWLIIPKPSRLQLRTKTLQTTEAQLDSELAVILRFMRTYVDTNVGYSKSLAQAHRNLHSLTKPEQVRTMVKFLIAENEKMQRDAADLQRNLEHSASQIEKLRWNLAEAQELGLRDPLTELSNRRCFDINLAREIDEAHIHNTTMCLVMGDIDRFKTINDTFGHQVGDEILKMFAKLLASNVKGRDTVARFGGEEFAIILPETRLTDAEHLTETIRSQLESKELALNTSGEPIGQITASFGVAELGAHDDADTLVQRADARLYEAKCAGRNRVVIDRPAAA
ncbi:MAG: GGDEF domain-containing protein [Hyphomonadaceae bacterium]|nr:GGDEF domain-containing protein [Hyphomonadaceae bacterium]